MKNFTFTTNEIDDESVIITVCEHYCPETNPHAVAISHVTIKIEDINNLVKNCLHFESLYSVLKKPPEYKLSVVTDSNGKISDNLVKGG